MIWVSPTGKIFKVDMTPAELKKSCENTMNIPPEIPGKKIGWDIICLISLIFQVTEIVMRLFILPYAFCYEQRT